MADIESLINHGPDITIHTVSGIVNGDDVVQRMEEYHSGEITDLIIWDFSNADIKDLPTRKIEEVARIGKEFAESRKGGKTALISSEDYTFGLGRMYEVFAEIESFPIEIRVFRNMKEAKNWLGL